MMLDTDFHKNLYWTVDGKKTYSKIQAMMWSRANLDKIKFYFFDKEWAHHNWSVPPKYSVRQLAEDRCYQLRASTNHLCLWLSSGYDSVTILNTFIKLGLPIDEICTYGRRETDPEYPLALAFAENYKNNHNPNVKITKVPLDFQYIKNFYKTHKDNVLTLPGGFSSLRLTKSSVHFVSCGSDIAQAMIHSKSDRIDMSGFEKPRVTLHNNVWYAMFPDDAVYDHAGSRTKGFWLDDDCWELYHAQCWAVIDWFETLPELTEELVHKIQNNDSDYYAQWSINCGRDPIYNNYSHSAQGKHFFKSAISSPDSQPYIEHFQKDSPELINGYLNNLRDFHSLMKDDWLTIYSDFPVTKYTKCSEPKLLRPRKNKFGKL